MRIFIPAICWLVFQTCLAVRFGDVVFSELMADPEPLVGLPSVEYVELCNRSASTIHLTGWNLLYGEKAYPLPAYDLAAGSYLVLCAKASVSAFSSGIPVAGMTAFPTLINSGKLMGLVSDEGQPVACLDYSDQWYGSGFKAAGGWSLECVDLSDFSGSSANWKASVDLSGGTPGRLNSVSSETKERESPILLRCYVPSPSTLELHFSTFLPLEALQSVMSFRVFPEKTLVLKAEVRLPELRVVTLTLSDTLVAGENYRLDLSGLMDVNGSLLPDSSLLLALPEAPFPGDLQWNELLFNPLPNGCDYAEFVNTSDHCVDLSRVWISNLAEDGSLHPGRRLSEKPLPCLPGSYWLLSECRDSVCRAGPFPAMPNWLDIKNFPSMPDEAGNICLVTTSAACIDAVTYREQMHLSLLQSYEGVALEKLRPEAVSSIASNWVSAGSTVHYGTPGYENSQRWTPEYKDVTGFYTQQAWMTPNDDGKDDRIHLCYAFPESCVGSLHLFDLQGREVRTLANNALLGSIGTIDWDGATSQGSMAPPGRYILFAEAFTPSGRVFRNRLVLTILF